MALDKKNLVPGTVVRAVSQELHDEDPRYFPAVGTVGEVKFRWQGEHRCFVKWPPGTTMGDGLWSAPIDALEVVEADGAGAPDEILPERGS